MGLKNFVKVGNITNLSDARYCAGMGVDILGFPVTSEADIREAGAQFSAIKEWVSGVSFAGEFTGLGLDDIKTALQAFDFDMIEIDNIDFVEDLHLLGKPVIFRSTIGNMIDLNRLRSRLGYLDDWVRYLVLRCENKALHEDLDCFLQGYEGSIRMLKGYGLSPVNTESLRVYCGIALIASEEERPGYKDYGMVMDVLEALDEG